MHVRVTEALVGGVPVPPGTVQRELARVNPVVDLTAAPVPLRIRTIALHGDRLEVLVGTE